ncbi:MAG: ribonuclease HI [Desulfobacterales bacterium]|nr:ribonuclease HI [Desulfobacterales bacterium]
MDESPDINWQRMSFKGNKVWAAFSGDNTPAVKNNKVRIKYNLDQTHEYWIKLDNLKPVDQAVPARPKKDKAPKEKEGSGKKKKTSRKNPPPNQNLPENCIRIYTDGASSGNPGPAGIGVLLLYKENRKEISESIGTATSNIAELTAIHRALTALKRRDLPVRIFTDSAYAVGLLSQQWQPQVNQELVVDIKTMMKEFSDIAVVKVEGHAGIKENEVADFLATRGINKGSSSTA